MIRPSGDRYLIAEVRIIIPSLTTQGRDAVVRFLRDTAVKIETSNCGQWDWEQPARVHKLKMAR